MWLEQENKIRVPDPKSNTYSEDDDVYEKSLYNEKSGTNQPVRIDWTDIKSKLCTPMDEKRVLVMICPRFEISGTNLEEIPRSMGDNHEFQENRRAYGKCNFSPSGRGLF